MQAYKRATWLAACTGAGLGQMLRWMQQLSDVAPAGSGQPDQFSLCRQLAPQLQAMAGALQSCCTALAGVVMQKQQLTAALAELKELESRWV